ncbi:MAG TPA: hypothetical protein VLU06_10555 [Thermoanaerobaculia bacterium]|nr:hypothetical protein [Thermoanaerobaculia bacterium]
MMQERRRYDRRTGVALLSLVAATNVIPWMELLLGETVTAELLARSEIRVAVGTCVLALFLLLGAWFSGRHSPLPARPWIGRPRTAGLRFAIAAAAVNIALAGLIRWLGAGHAARFPSELPIFVIGWYLVVLPLEVVAGLSLGRAGRMPGRRQPPGL